MLAWPEPVTMREVQITFDSQLSGWIWEGSFPMIAKSYRIEGRDPKGAWLDLVSSENNSQRRRIHTFDHQSLDALRVTILETHGGATARIVEIRAYGENAGKEV